MVVNDLGLGARGARNVSAQHTGGRGKKGTLGLTTCPNLWFATAWEAVRPQPYGNSYQLVSNTFRDHLVCKSLRSCTPTTLWQLISKLHHPPPNHQPSPALWSLAQPSTYIALALAIHPGPIIRPSPSPSPYPSHHPCH